jgi:hypothetical protein
MVDEVTGEWIHPVHTTTTSSSGSGGGSSCEIGTNSGGRSSSIGRGSRVPMVQTYSSALGGYHLHHHSSSSSSASSSSNRVIVHRAKRMRMFYP